MKRRPTRGSRRMFVQSLAAALAASQAPAKAQPSRQRDLHKVAVSVDMEGISGVVGREETMFGSAEFRDARRWLLSDVNAAIQGAVEGGATHVDIHDTHGGNKRNLPYEELDARANLIRGGNQFFWEYDALDSTFGAAFLIGMHAGPLQPGIISHYFTAAFREVRLNGQPVTESHMTVALAAHFGIPTVLVTGDDRVCATVRDWSKGQIETVVTKRALSWNSGITIPLSRTREQIREAAQRAMKKAPEAALLRFKEPVSVSLELSKAEEAKSVVMMPGVRRAGDRHIEFTAADILQAHKALIAALMILHSPLAL